MDALPLQINLIVVDEYELPMHSTEVQILRVLANSNIISYENASLTMKGIVSITDVRLQEPRYIATANIDLQLILNNSGEIIGEISGRGQGLSERNEADAIERAFNSISLNSRELNLLAEKAETILESTLLSQSRLHLQNAKNFIDARQYNEAKESLFQVNVGETLILEALELLRKINDRT
jgi:hypothetical protein